MSYFSAPQNLCGIPHLPIATPLEPCPTCQHAKLHTSNQGTTTSQRGTIYGQGLSLNFGSSDSSCNDCLLAGLKNGKTCYCIITDHVTRLIQGKSFCSKAPPILYLHAWLVHSSCDSSVQDTYVCMDKGVNLVHVSQLAPFLRKEDLLQNPLHLAILIKMVWLNVPAIPLAIPSIPSSTEIIFPSSSGYTLFTMLFACITLSYMVILLSSPLSSGWARHQIFATVSLLAAACWLFLLAPVVCAHLRMTSMTVFCMDTCPPPAPFCTTILSTLPLMLPSNSLTLGFPNSPNYYPSL